MNIQDPRDGLANVINNSKNCTDPFRGLVDKYFMPHPSDIGIKRAANGYVVTIQGALHVAVDLNGVQAILAAHFKDVK